MKRFANLYLDLDQTKKPGLKVDALVEYLENESPENKLFALALLLGQRPPRTIIVSQLFSLASDLYSLPEWLVKESVKASDDLLETISLLLPVTDALTTRNLSQCYRMLVEFKGLTNEALEIAVKNAWVSMSKAEIYVFNKILTGGFRPGITRSEVVKALSRQIRVSATILHVRLKGDWNPLTTTFDELVFAQDQQALHAIPYPFCRPKHLAMMENLSGKWEHWQVEYYWDGLSVQFIKRNKNLFIWSEEEEPVSDKFPELHLLGSQLPDGTVIEGVIMHVINGELCPLEGASKRINRKGYRTKHVSDSPICLVAYDLLEFQGKDIQTKLLYERRQLLEKLCSSQPKELLKFSKTISIDHTSSTSPVLENARRVGAKGLIIKDVNSPYGVAQKDASCYFLKCNPLTINAILIYAAKGSGQGTGTFTELTFALWQDAELISITKAYSGLSSSETRQIDDFIKKNTLEKFGPVRSIKPALVFELSFDAIIPSPRHKSGIALKFPFIKRWRKDMIPEQANAIKDIQAFLMSQQ